MSVALPSTRAPEALSDSLAVTVACLMPSISTNMLKIPYFSLIVTGIIMFVSVNRNVLKWNIKMGPLQKEEED
ncbi:hypothetical protein [Methanococcoides alaskense]|uniref:Uncharacterized protein n=1 Tax=Methanococcoides alaskense TaxID=325778 RepID=A0AA90U2B9_9EURY|nr:hypothetical protein [Methanococcoides alaskense]MDA0525810.1 hypothetical protein [Methanococcoides alaskense]MDR6223964.1 hypothetical protein [Methanococcoides alaskense]